MHFKGICIDKAGEKKPFPIQLDSGWGCFGVVIQNENSLPIPQLMLPFGFHTLNQTVAADRSSYHAANDYKKLIAKKVYFYVKQQNFSINKTKKYNLRFQWFRMNEKTDHDNIAGGIKIILDALTEPKARKKYGCGVLKDDSPKYVGSLYHDFYYSEEIKEDSLIIQFFEV